MFDFDKNFEEYAIKWCDAHRGEYSEDELEDMMPELYEKWANQPIDELKGLTPVQFFDKIDPPTLVKLLVSACDGGAHPSSLLLDKIAEKPECAQGLIDIVRASRNCECRMISINLLSEMGAAHPLDIYASFICDESVDDDLRDLAVEIMCDYPNEVSDKLYKLIPSATFSEKEIIAEILVNAKHDDRTYRLLEELFASSENLAYHAALVGKYGDERAAAMLYRALDTCNYAEFIEVRNAIERMGGVVDDGIRDFSDDPYYIALKGTVE